MCLLVIGVVALAIRAKTSQYPNQASFSRHLSKATKMSNDRTQRSVAVVPVEIPCFDVPEKPVPLEPAPVVTVRPKRPEFLPAFRFRPPPTSV